jgi:hypothetical protein
MFAMEKKILKFVCLKPAHPISINIGTSYPGVKGIQVCTNKGTGPLWYLSDFFTV